HRFSSISATNHSLILPKYPLNPPRIPDNQASGLPFRRQQAHLA
ncbi:SAM-dependent DNA methyltransferase, partial [Neisseria meningitidis]|nr:SAM-dependent DNA methyltransferase [Neisseria meningitidis]MBG9005138.1 SAM-dependent DNA methyltransferase [Neisseria meningitidis]MBG9019328.1 SAM-dependent DNA methyltransferase [Neisseria meningitidis]MBG9037445.1 SAM-dependent DNA methyltransferase [Neisseria meningitidis]MBJ6650250.1 SAM-dependent DNA methyltransferase [Neisseria meningitidis]